VPSVLGLNPISLFCARLTGESFPSTAFATAIFNLCYPMPTPTRALGNTDAPPAYLAYYECSAPTISFRKFPTLTVISPLLADARLSLPSLPLTASPSSSLTSLPLDRFQCRQSTLRKPLLKSKKLRPDVIDHRYSWTA